MKLKLISSLILTGLLLTSFGTPVKAGIFSKIKNTVQDVTDPGGHIRGTVRGVTNKVKYKFRIQNNSSRKMSFTIGLEPFSLAPNYYVNVEIYGSNQLKLYNSPDVEGSENSTVSYSLGNNRSYVIVEDVGSQYELRQQ